jgi:hypothetical protein
LPYDSWAAATDSIKLALDAADPWDTILVAAGAYTADSLPLKKGVVFKGAGMDSTYIHHNGNYAYAVIMSDSCVVEGFHLDGIVDTLGPGGLDYIMYYGVLGGSAKFGVIRNNRFTHARYAVELLFNDNVAVDSNTFSHCYIGVNLWWASTAIRGNTFHRDDVTAGGPIQWNSGIDAAIEGNTFFHEAGKFGDAIYLDQVDHITIRNNSFVAPRQLDDSIYRNRVAICSNCASAGYPTTGVIENNLFVGGELGIGSYGGDVVIRNNAIVGSKARDLVYDTNSTTPGNIRFNLFWENRNVNQPNVDTTERLASGCLFADPMFRDSLDFHLQAFSPAIDAGDTLLLDPDGSRSDIGPYGGPLGQVYAYIDLPPRVPSGLIATASDTIIQLSWTANHEADFARYDLFRDSFSISAPSPALWIASMGPESSFTDYVAATNGVYYYRLQSVDQQDHPSDLSSEVSVVVTDVGPQDVVPTTFSLGPTYPNPFNASTRIPFEVETGQRGSAVLVRLEIFDVRGRRVCTLINGVLPTGKHVASWDGTDSFGKRAASGIYFVRLICSNAVLSRKLLLLK